MGHRSDSELINSFYKLKTYCEKEGFKGWDPYDGLNSKIFQATLLKHSRLARLAWIQAFKRNHVNLRKILCVPKGYNAKGIALFLIGYCNLYKVAQKGEDSFGTREEIISHINFLSDLLISLQSKGYSGACWGYNFDWQNRVFFQPSGTPTVVATSFCAEALFNSYSVTQERKMLDVALSACNFVEKDLNRADFGNNNFIFSYSPLDRSQVYNASLLGARLLARGYSYTQKEEWRELAYHATITIIERQSSDGSWVYGASTVQQWVDSFHTGFNLECVRDIMDDLKIHDFEESFNNGHNYYLNNFFLEDGTPKYYHNKIYPLDIHSPAQLIVTLSKCRTFYSNRQLAERVLNWTINNMQSPKGNFYYQLKKGMSSKISYMRWAQAWVFYAMSYFFMETTIMSDNK